MKYLFAAILVLGFAAGSQAQEMSPNMFELSGGFDVLSGPSSLTDFWNSGGGTTLTYYRFLSQSLALTASVGGNRFGINRTRVEEYVTGELPDSLGYLVDLLNVENGDVFVASGKVGLAYDLQIKDSSFEETNEGKVFFYPRAAVGVAYNSINDLELGLLGQSTTATVEGASKVSLTVEGGVGFRFFLTNNLGLSLEGTFVANFLETETLTYIPIRVGVVYR